MIGPLSRAMASIHITDIEAAINHWRARTPSSNGGALCPPLLALAEVYALMVFRRHDAIDDGALPAAALEAWHDWYQTTPDTPCIPHQTVNRIRIWQVRSWGVLLELHRSKSVHRTFPQVALCSLRG